MQNNQDTKETVVTKPGRTLLVKSSSNNQLKESLFSGLVGLKSKSATKTSNSYFLNFDTVENSAAALAVLETKPECMAKYSYYRVFFTMNGLTDTTDYNTVKKELTDYVSNRTSSPVLFCKFYRKDSKYLGCGDMTVDTLEAMNTLLSKEDGQKEYTFGSYTGSFYRYNSTGSKSKTSSA